MSGKTKAIFLVIMAGCFLATMDACAKYLGSTLPIEQILWGRYFSHSVLMFIILWKTHSYTFLICKHPKMQIGRSLTLLGATAGAYFALKYFSLGDATAIFFFAPVLVTALSAVFLKETINWKHIAIILTGFMGVIIIINPSSDSISFVTFIPLASAVMLASYMLLTRSLQQKDSEPATLFYATALGSLLLCFIVPFKWVEPSFSQALIMTLMGVLGAVGHFLLVKAFSFASASTLSPFLYAQLLCATVISIVFFQDPVSINFLVGASILVGCGLYQWKIQS